MPQDVGYTLPGQAVRELHEVKTLVLGGSRTRRKKEKRRRGGGGGGGGGTLDVLFGRTVSSVSAASGWSLALAGEGEFQRIDAGGDDDGDPITIKNRYFDTIPSGVPGFVIQMGGAATWVGLNFGCASGPTS